MGVAGRVEKFKQNYLDESFKTMLAASVGLHLAVVLALTVRTYVFPEDELNFDTAIQVDMVDLPDKFQKLPPVAQDKKAEEKKPEPKTPPVEKPKEAKKTEEPAKLDLKAKKKEKADALEKINAMKALDSIKEEVDAEEEKQKQANTKVKGNKLSSGTALTGIVTSQMAGYKNILERHAKEHWSLPKWLQDLDLKARAHVFIESDGTVSRRYIVQSSGNETYDNLVLSSIDSASPFPAPPKHFVDLLKVKGIQLGFPE